MNEWKYDDDDDSDDDEYSAPTHTHTRLMAPFVQDYPSEPVPER